MSASVSVVIFYASLGFGSAIIWTNSGIRSGFGFNNYLNNYIVWNIYKCNTRTSLCEW
jgi:hypothetical protein